VTRQSVRSAGRVLRRSTVRVTATALSTSGFADRVPDSVAGFLRRVSARCPSGRERREYSAARVADLAWTADDDESSSRDRTGYLPRGPTPTHTGPNSAARIAPPSARDHTSRLTRRLRRDFPAAATSRYPKQNV
jgi:hypothetical protein